MASTQRPELLSSNSFGNPTQTTASQPMSGSSTAATSPTEPPTSTSSARLPIGSGLSSTPNGLGAIRTGSPNHDFTGRLFPKRAREIQAQEGIKPQIWGPPTSGHSTPLHETIPESPSGDSFPDFQQSQSDNSASSTPIRGRARAGTLPSRLGLPPAPGLGLLGGPPPGLIPKTSRPTPSTSPFKPNSNNPNDPIGFSSSAALNSKAALLSRLRAGSMPQRANLATGSPFGQSLFSSSWANRDRSNTLASIRSSEGLPSPAQSSFSRESLADADVRTLDYLGLVDTPKPVYSTLAGQDINALLYQQASSGLPPQTLADLTAFTKNANRFRSYSVNAKEKYADDEDEYGSMGYGGNYSGTLTPAENAAALNLQEMVRQHNLEVQAFTNLANQRPRARTAGILDSPSNRLLRSYLPTPSRLDNSLMATDLQLAEEAEYSGLEEAVEQMHLKHSGGLFPEVAGDDHSNEAPTRALWLGNIPSSTTVSSLTVIFSPFGAIESARVLTHKNCGFVNFDTIESAVSARSHLNGKEIFPGAGPVRIGYAKVPSASATPGTGAIPSPSPDPQSKGQGEATFAGANNSANVATPADLPASKTLDLAEVKSEIIAIVKELGATEEDLQRITPHIDQAIQYNNYHNEIPSVPEPSHSRVHDAPRLREIRKRIDNNTCTPQEIEEVAINMLDEVAELASDYLGNTVVQKLFEYCSENVKQAMLERIAPHLAEIGVHKNGTWAAQKIIDVAKQPALMAMVVDSLRPFAMSLFLDQFGNYVMQGCLRYSYPLNNFIFDVMLCRLWELAQGRFGARAMRACLESHYATKDQQRMIAATIALHSVQLATNANGALLLTWFLDTCTFPRRRTVLAPRLVPHLVRLCTHKVAYLTVLKIINQRNEPEARDTILKALFFSPNDKVLEDILSDQQCGATLIFKVLTTPFFDENIRPDVVQNVRNVLVRIKAQPQQGYKRLMDEVGLSTRNGGGRDIHQQRDDNRPSSKHSNGHMSTTPTDSPISRPFYPGMQGPYDMGMNMQRTGSMDSSTYESYTPSTMQTPVYPTSAPGMPPPMTPQQLQYQQMMASRPSPAANFYPQAVSMNGGYPSPAPSMDAYRNGVHGMGGMNNPLMPQAGFASPSYGGHAQGMFQGYPMQYVQPGMAHNGGLGGGQRGRRMG